MYSVISATKWAASCDFDHEEDSASSCYTLSTTSATTGSVTLTCKGNCCATWDSSFSWEVRVYEYVVQAKSVYNGTTATVNVKFSSSYHNNISRPIYD